MAKLKKELSRSKITFFGRKNYYILAIGIAVLIIGFILMSIGPVNSFWSLTLSPIVLLIAFLVIIPWSIFYREKEENPGA